MRVFESVPPSVFIMTAVAVLGAALAGAPGAVAVLIVWVCCELSYRADHYGVHRDEEKG